MTKEFIESMIDIIPDAGCWIWKGYLNHCGYGTAHGKVLAHRLAYSTFNGPIPPKLNVLHRCDVRCCVNPNHLFLGNQLDNMGDASRKGRLQNSCGNASKTHCKRGHEYTVGNTYKGKNNSRQCIQCRKIASFLFYNKE